MPKSFCRTPGLHCYYASSENSEFQCRFFVSVQSHVKCVPGALCTAPPPCPEYRMRTWLVPGVGGTLAHLRWHLPRRQNLPWRPTGGTLRHNAVRHRPSHLGAPRGRLPCQRTHAAPSTWLGTHGARSLPPTCRTTVLLRTGRNHPSRAELDAEMAPMLHLDDAQDPKPTVQPQRRRNHSPDLSVHGNRLAPAINSASELTLAPAHLHHLTRPRLATGRASRGLSSSTPATSVRLGLRQHSLR